MTLTKTLTATQKKTIESKALSLFKKACKKYGFSEVPIVEVKFFTKGSCGGRAVSTLNRIGMQLRFNAIIARDDWDNFLAEVIPHEVAHLIANMIQWRCQPHGKLWRSICIELGGTGNRCHNLNTQNCEYRKNSVKWTCSGCGNTGTVSTRKYNEWKRENAFPRLRHSCGCMGGLIFKI